MSQRTPLETRPGRMTPMARLPLFHDLAGRRVLLAGGSDAAAWKAELLSAAGADLIVVAANAGPEMRAVCADRAERRITLEDRHWRAGDFDGVALAVGAFEDETEAARFAAAARAARVPVNVVDRPHLCDFAFGSIVNRSPLVIGISTDGAAPVFAQAIRAKIEAMLPAGLAAWAAAAKAWRPSVLALGLDAAARRRFWRRFTDRALAVANESPDASLLAELSARSRQDSQAPTRGSVTLVGAGPGDAELLTLKAVRALQAADVILYDDLVSQDVLDFARREAKTMLVGKRGHGPSCKQSDINALLVGLARQGKHVVRLKGGDPLIFGQAGEEIDACRDANIDVSIAPGISAAQGAAAALGLSLTHRETGRRVQFVAGHARSGDLPDDLPGAALADPATTTIVYMPRNTCAALAARAMAAGLPPETPVVAVVNATRKNQHVTPTTIGAAAASVAGAPEGPLLLMIGDRLREPAIAGDEEETRERASSAG